LFGYLLYFFHFLVRLEEGTYYIIVSLLEQQWCRRDREMRAFIALAIHQRVIIAEFVKKPTLLTSSHPNSHPHTKDSTWVGHGSKWTFREALYAKLPNDGNESGSKTPFSYFLQFH
jgi:hypothetical protein